MSQSLLRSRRLHVLPFDIYENRLSRSGLLGACVAFTRLWLYINRHRPQTVLADTLIGQVTAHWACCLSPGVRFAVRQGGIVSFRATASGSVATRIKTRAKAAMRERALRGAWIVITPSAAGKESITDVGVSESKVNVIANGIDMPCYAASCFSGDGAAIRALVVSNLDERKAVHEAISAVAEVRKSAKQPIFLDIFGRGPKRAELQKLITELGLTDVATLRGFRRKPWQLDFRNAVLLHPSKSDGFGYAVLEAIAQGIPAIVFAGVGGPEEIVRKTGGGKVVSMRCPTRMAEAISELFADPIALEQRMSRARRQAYKHYSLDSMIAGYERCLA